MMSFILTFAPNTNDIRATNGIDTQYLPDLQVSASVILTTE
jgi:hypothetical protein